MSLKRQYPNAKFIIYTSPEHHLLFKSILDANLYASYERWLNDLVEVFGEVYDFSSPNSVNNNINNFLDGSHFHPSVGTWIANKITGTADPSIPPDFGRLITKDNVKEYLFLLKKTTGFIK